LECETPVRVGRALTFAAGSRAGIPGSTIFTYRRKRKGFDPMSKIAFALLLCLVPASWSLAAEPPAPAASPVAQAVAAIKLKPNWERIELTLDTRSHCSLTLWYKPEAKVTSEADVEADTKQVARAVLAELVRQGRKPAEERISLFVYGRQETRGGETGGRVVRTYGNAIYDSNHDRLGFAPSYFYKWPSER
jgi:hypothetical protein